MPTFRARWMRKGCQQSRLRRNSTRGRRKTKRVQVLEKREECFKESVCMILLLKVWASDQ